MNLPNLPAGPGVTWGIPNVTFNEGGYAGFGDNSDGPYQNQNNTTQFLDNISWNKGKHSFKFGFEYDRQNFNQIRQPVHSRPVRLQCLLNRTDRIQREGNTGTGDAFAEFLLGDIYQPTVAVAAAQAAFQRNNEYAFIDDTWKVTSKLTLSIGLRYELCRRSRTSSTTYSLSMCRKTS